MIDRQGFRCYRSDAVTSACSRPPSVHVTLAAAGCSDLCVWRVVRGPTERLIPRGCQKIVGLHRHDFVCHPRSRPQSERYVYVSPRLARDLTMIKLFSLKQAKKDGESPKAGTQKKASAAQLRITKGSGFCSDASTLLRLLSLAFLFQT